MICTYAHNYTSGRGAAGAGRNQNVQAWKHAKAIGKDIHEGKGLFTRIHAGINVPIEIDRSEPTDK